MSPCFAQRPASLWPRGRRVRDPAAMSLITVPDVIGKLEAAFAERGVAPVTEPSSRSKPWTDIR